MAVCKDRDTKAELNRRGEVCEASLTPGFRVAENGRASGYRAPYSGLEDRRVSLNTYARGNGVPCGSCTHLNGFADHCLGCSANGT